jgi:hypothetical protein
VNAKGKNFTQLTYDKEPAPSITMKIAVQNEDIDQLMLAYLQNNREQDENYLKYGGPKGRILKEVKIKAVKRYDDYRSSNLAGPGHADIVVHAEQMENMGGFLTDVLRNFHGLPLNGVIVVDGIKMFPGFDLNSIPAHDVETVEGLKYTASAAIYGMDAGHRGVLIITTKRGGWDPKDIASYGILPITVNGFHKAREFYSPKYEHPEVTNRKDPRSTIYWKPEIVTDKDGNASFEYYNADGTGTYRVVIEGIDDKGDIGRQVYRYKVE